MAWLCRPRRIPLPSRIHVPLPPAPILGILPATPSRLLSVANGPHTMHKCPSNRMLSQVEHLLSLTPGEVVTTIRALSTEAGTRLTAPCTVSSPEAPPRTAAASDCETSVDGSPLGSATRHFPLLGTRCRRIVAIAPQRMGLTSGIRRWLLCDRIADRLVSISSHHQSLSLVHNPPQPAPHTHSHRMYQPLRPRAVPFSPHLLNQPRDLRSRQSLSRRQRPCPVAGIGGLSLHQATSLHGNGRGTYVRLTSRRSVKSTKSKHSKY